jgi:N-acetyl-gamma-glutamyl-phosphate reductase
MDRGILSTCYAQPTRQVSTDDLLSIYRDFYAGEPFIRVVAGLPATKHVAVTNFCDLTARAVRGRVLSISTIDNLIKGAAGAAVQNFNLMSGVPETTALL